MPYTRFDNISSVDGEWPKDKLMTMLDETLTRPEDRELFRLNEKK